MVIFLICLCALGALALVAQTFVFRWLFNRGHEANKMLADELEKLQKGYSNVLKISDHNHDNACSWMERFKGLEELAAETGEKNKKHIAKLEDELKHNITTKEALYKAVAEREDKMRTAWAVHQVVTVYGKPRIVCLSAVVFAENGMKAKAAFFDVTKEAKRHLKIRTVSPIQANKVFPNI